MRRRSLPRNGAALLAWGTVGAGTPEMEGMMRRALVALTVVALALPLSAASKDDQPVMAAKVFAAITGCGASARP